MKRFLALLLSVLMLTALLPFAVWAEEEEETLLAEPAPEQEVPALTEEPAAEEPAEEPPAEAPIGEPSAPEMPGEPDPVTEEPTEEEQETPGAPEADEPAPAESEPEEQTEAPAQEQPAEEPEEEPELTVAPLQDAVITNGAAELVCKASVNVPGVTLHYQWQRLDSSTAYENDLARAEAWEDIPGADGAKLSFTEIDEETFAAECAPYLFRCVVRTEEDAELSTEARLLPDPAWAEAPAEEELPADGEDEKTLLAEPEEPVPAEEEDEKTLLAAPAYGKCGDSQTWVVKDGTLTISGKGFMYDYSETDAPWNSCANEITSIVIEADVRDISDRAFKECTEYQRVEFKGDPPTFAGNGDAFYPNDVYAFYPADNTSWTSTTKRDYGGHLTWIPVSAGTWGGNVNWTYYDFGSKAGELIVEGAGDMIDGKLPPFDTDNGGRPIDVAKVSVGYGITGIGAHAFEGGINITSITLPSTLLRIGDSAFANNAMLSSITLPDNLQSIGESAFNGTKITGIRIPASVRSIGKYAFERSFLEMIVFMGSMPDMSPNIFHRETEAYYPDHDASWDPEKLKQPANGATTWIRRGAIDSGACGEHVRWGVYDNNELILQGWGDMYDYSETDVPWSTYAHTVTKVTVLDGVTNIGDNTFKDFTAMKSLYLPASVSGFGSNAFAGCTALEELTVGGSPVSLGANAFKGCTALGRIMFLGSADEFAADCFTNVTAEVYYPEGKSGWTDYIDQSFGGELTWVRTVTGFCGEGITFTFYDKGYGQGELFIKGNGAMYDEVISVMDPEKDGKRQNVGTVTVGSGITHIGNSAFYGGYNISAVTLPDTLTSIGNSAFGYNTALRSITLPENLQSIGNSAFRETGISSIVIPASVQSMGEKVFMSCSSLTQVEFLGHAPAFDPNCFNGRTLTVYYPGDDSTWTLEVRQQYGGTVTWVPAGTQQYGTCPGTLITWTLTQTGTLVLSGYGNIPDYFGSDAPWYAYRDSIREVILEGVIPTVGANAFRDLQKVTAVTLSETLGYIGSDAFSGCLMLTEVSFPASLESIGAGAFSGCYGLEKITFTGDAPAFDDNCFGNVLAEVFYPAENETWTQEKRAQYGGTLTWITVLSGRCGDNAVWTWNDTGELIVSGTGDMYDGCLPPFADGKTVTGVTVLSGITGIGKQAFSGSETLTAVILPDTVTDIGESAFSMTGISMLYIPASVRSVGRNAFAGTPLKEVVFEGAAPRFGEDCFLGVTAMVCYNAAQAGWTEEVLQQYGGTLTWLAEGGDNSGSCGENVFWKYNEGELTFYGEGDMYDYTVGTAPWYAFADRISSVVFRGNILYIGANAFAGCDALLTVTYFGDDWSAVTVAAGNNQLTAAQLKRVSASATVTVLDPAGTDIGGQTVLTDREQAQTAALRAELLPECDTPVLWSSDDPDTASVDSTGLVTFRKPGTAVITAAAGDVSEHVTFVIYDGSGLMKLDREYILLAQEDSVTVHMTWNGPEAELLVAEAEGDCLALTGSSWDHMTVKGVAPGAGYVTFKATVGGETYSVSCRIDVVDSAAVSEKVDSVQLATPSATVEVYKQTDLPVLTVVPVLAQNLKLQGPDEDQGVAIASARFKDDALNAFFTLRVLDDRTLEIVPTAIAVTAAQTGSKDLRSGYSSPLLITIGTAEFTTAPLKLSVKKNAPTVRAQAVAFNSCLKDLEYGLSFTGGQITGLTPVSIPDWAVLDGFTLRLSENAPEKYPAKGTMKMQATVEGWCVPVIVSVPYTVKATVPKLTFSEKKVTLLQNTTDAAHIAITVSPEPYTDAGLFPVTLTKIEVKSGSKYEQIPNGKELFCTVQDNIFSVKSPCPVADGKARTYRITFSCADWEYTYTVKTRASSSRPQFTVRSSGAIHTLVENSPLTLTLTPKNFRAGSGERFYIDSVTKYNGSVAEDASGLFNVTEAGNVFTFTEKTPGTLEKGCTYTVVFGMDMNGDGKAECLTSAGLKITFAKTAPKITASLKASGSFDLTRPASAITLKSALSNWYGEKTQRLVFTKKLGRTVTEFAPGDELPFDVTENSDGTYTLTVNARYEAGAVYSVRFEATVAGTVYPSKTVKLTAKQGKVAVKSSLSEAMMLRNDRFSRVSFRLSIDDPEVAPLTHAELDAASAKKFSLHEVQPGLYELEYLHNELPKSFKASTVKVNVFVQGCEKAAATVKIKVSYK